MVLDVKDLRYHLPANGRTLVDGSPSPWEPVRHCPARPQRLREDRRPEAREPPTHADGRRRADRGRAGSGGPVRRAAAPHRLRDSGRGTLPTFPSPPTSDCCRGSSSGPRIVSSVACASSSRSWTRPRHLRRALPASALRRSAPARRHRPRPGPRSTAAAPRRAIRRARPITRLELQREFRALEGTLGKAMVLVTHDVREGCCSARASGCSTPDGWRFSERRTSFAQHAARGPQIHGGRVRLFEFYGRHADEVCCS